MSILVIKGTMIYVQNNPLIIDEKKINVEIRSRHSESEKYKIFVEYVSNKNDYEGVTEWICTCLSGKR